MRSRAICGGMRLRSAAPELSEAVRGGELQLLPGDAGRPEGTDSAVEALHAATDQALGEAVGQDWVKQNFPPAAKAEYGQAGGRAGARHWLRISQELDWMSDATKVEAKKKLDAFRNKIGYPENVARLLAVRW